MLKLLKMFLAIVSALVTSATFFSIVDAQERVFTYKEPYRSRKSRPVRDVGAGLVACTKDQGKTWKSTLFEGEAFVGIAWKSAKEIHLIGKGAGFISKDGGQTWSRYLGK